MLQDICDYVFIAKCFLPGKEKKTSKEREKGEIKN